MTIKTHKHQSIAIVTGGASGIGSAIAHRFSVNGFKVVIIDKVPPGAPAERAKGAVYWRADLSDLKAIRSLPLDQFATEVRAQSITVVNNVSLRGTARFLEESEDSWAESINTSLSASVFLTQSAIKVAQRRNLTLKICNISSVLSAVVGNQSASYGVAKAGLEYLTKYYTVLGKEIDLAIKSVAVAPGMIVQDRHAARFFSSDNSSYRSLVELVHPQSSHATDSDLSDFVYWLTEESPVFLNGQTVIYDGGLTVQDPLTVAQRVAKNLSDTQNGFAPS